MQKVVKHATNSKHRLMLVTLSHFIYLLIHSCKNENKIWNTIDIKANATVIHHSHQGISLTDAFITNISTVT